MSFSFIGVIQNVKTLSFYETIINPEKLLTNYRSLTRTLKCFTANHDTFTRQ